MKSEKLYLEFPFFLTFFFVVNVVIFVVVVVLPFWSRRVEAR